LTGRDPVRDYKVIQNELKAFNPDLVARKQIIAANKIDLLDEVQQERLTAVRRLARREKKPFVAISAARGDGLSELVSLLARMLKEEKEEKSDKD